MAIREIKATLALDGEKKFKAGLDDASRSLRVMDTGLKAIEASYGNTGDKSTMLAKKSEVLKQELEQQKSIVSALGGAVQEAAKKYGDTAKQTDGYRIKLNTALKKQAEMEKAIRDTEREMDELGRESKSTGREIENGIGEAAQNAAKDLREMYDEMQGDVRSVKMATGISAVKDLGGTIIDAAQGLFDFAEGSREYRRQLSFLKQNAESAGQDYEFVKMLLFDVAGMTGEVDGAVEGLSNLLAAGFDSSEMVKAIDLLKGAVIQFPDTMKFESLADSLQETIATGEATGQYSELLGRLGVDVETFNKAMEKAKTAEERQQVALSFLANNGLKEVNDEYAEANKSIIEAEETSLRLNDEMAELGGTTERLIATPAKKVGADVANELNNTLLGLERWKNTGDWKQMFEGAGDPEADAEAAAQMESDEAQEYYKNLAEQMKQNGIDPVTMPVAEREKTVYDEYKEIDASLAEAEANRQRLIAEAQAAEEAAEAAKEAQEVASEAEKAGAKTVADEWEEINASIEEAEANRQRLIAEAQAAEAAAGETAEMMAEEEGNWLSKLWKKITGQDETEEELKNKGSDAVESVQNGMEEAEPAASSAAQTAGNNIATATANGIIAGTPGAVSAAAAMVDGVNAELLRLGNPFGGNLTNGLYDRPSAGPVSRNASASASGGGTIVVPLYMDSSKVGEAVIPSVSAGMGSQIKQLISIG